MLIDWFTVAAQVVNFLILIWLLKRFLYRPVLAAIDEREKRIAAELRDADIKKAKALNERAAFQLQIEEFESHRLRLLSEAEDAAKAERNKLLEVARKDANALRAKLQKSASDELEIVNRKIGALAQREVFSIAEKVLKDMTGISLQEQATELFLIRLHELVGKQHDDLQTALHSSAKPVLVRSAFQLGDPQRAAIASALKIFLDPEPTIDFQINPDLIGGIELIANGQKFSWSIAGYLASLTNSVTALLAPKVDRIANSPEIAPHAA